MLNVILWTPLLVGLICFVLPRRLAGWASVAGAVASLGLIIAVIFDFKSGSGELQKTVSESWIPDLGVRYELGIDGISLFLVLLTGIGWLAANLYSALQLPDRARTYFFQMGLAQTATVGAFLAQDLLLFVLFFDLMLIPFYFLIGGWGVGERSERIAATIKMIIYTLVGSLLMLIAAIATGVLAGVGPGGSTSFNIEALASQPLPLSDQEWIFWFFAAAFLVKMPAFLVHGWMADAYRHAPLPVLALLSGVLSKVAAYGFLRVVLPVFPDATIEYQEIILIIGVASILYGSIMAFTQTNVRLIAGYSSIAQLGFITIGVFSLRSDGADGAVIQMFNHGLVVLPLFFIIALLYERYGTDDIREMGGMAKNAPILAIMFVIVTMAMLAIPGSANFIGEFYILTGLFQTKVALALIASTGIALAAFYSLRMYQRSMHNRLPDGAVSREMSVTEGVVIVPLVLCIVAIGLYPGLIVERGEAAVDKSVASVAIADCGLYYEAAGTQTLVAVGDEGKGGGSELGFDDPNVSGLPEGHPELDQVFDPECFAGFGLVDEHEGEGGEHGGDEESHSDDGHSSDGEHGGASEQPTNEDAPAVGTEETESAQLEADGKLSRAECDEIFGAIVDGEADQPSTQELKDLSERCPGAPNVKFATPIEPGAETGEAGGAGE